MTSDEAFLEVIRHTPLVSIDLICRDNQQRVLLGKRVNRPAQDTWFVPGGRIRKNETIASAIARISSTELGIQLSLADAELLGTYEHLYDDNYLGQAGIGTHYVVLAHSFQLGDQQPRPDSQHTSLRWWTVNNLLDHPAVHTNTKNYFQAVQALS